MTLSGQVELIRQAFGYISQFRGKLFVIKIDTEIIMDPLFAVLVSDLALLHRLGIRIAIVPGAQSRIDEILTKYGDPVEDRRTASASRRAEAIPFIKMAAFDVSNRVMTLLAENRVDGVIGNWVRARAIGVRDGVDYQESGLVDRIKGDIVRSVLADGVIPIFPNIGWSAGGQAVQHLLGRAGGQPRAASCSPRSCSSCGRGPASRPADYRLPADIEPARDGCLPQAHRTSRRGSSWSSTRAAPRTAALNLVRLACQACESGVPRVHVVDGRLDGVVLKEIFSSEGAGTMIYADEHAGHPADEARGHPAGPAHHAARGGKGDPRAAQRRAARGAARRLRRVRGRRPRARLRRPAPVFRGTRPRSRGSPSTTAT